MSAFERMKLKKQQELFRPVTRTKIVGSALPSHRLGSGPSVCAARVEAKPTPISASAATIFMDLRFITTILTTSKNVPGCLHLGADSPNPCW